MPVAQQVADGFVVELERFQGPLDLLLHLIREQDIDIFDIPIARITKQFLAAIEGVETFALDRAGEFLEMAATLLRIKVQMLLPRRVDEEGELVDPRAELVRRLLEYEHFRDAAKRLAEAEVERSRRYARGYIPPAPRRKVVETPLETGWDEVWAAALGVASSNGRPAEFRIRRRIVPLEEKVSLIVATLKRLARIEFRQLVGPAGSRSHVIATLLASLELARRRLLRIRQREPFAPLWLCRRESPAVLQNGGGDNLTGMDGNHADR